MKFQISTILFQVKSLGALHRKFAPFQKKKNHMPDFLCLRTWGVDNLWLEHLLYQGKTDLALSKQKKKKQNKQSEKKKEKKKKDWFSYWRKPYVSE